MQHLAVEGPRSIVDPTRLPQVLLPEKVRCLISEADDIPSLDQAIAAGIGIGAMSAFARVRRRRFVRVLPRYAFAEVPVSLVSPSRRLEPACVTLLRDFLVEKLASVHWSR
jgi:DNA-binding transcriptional LysR family regulator